MSDVTICKSAEQCKEHAEKSGLVAFFGNDNWLLLDLDDGLVVPASDALDLVIMADLLDLRTRFIYTTSKSGINKHCYIKLNQPLSHDRRVALQALLGSDPKRETLTVLQDSRFTCLYETPGEFIKVPSELKEIPIEN